MNIVKGNTNVERIRTTKGKIQVYLKEDKGSGKRISNENPDDLFRMGIDIAATDLTQFGYHDIDVLESESPSPPSCIPSLIFNRFITFNSSSFVHLIDSIAFSLHNNANFNVNCKDGSS